MLSSQRLLAVANPRILAVVKPTTTAVVKPRLLSGCQAIDYYRLSSHDYFEVVEPSLVS